MAMSLVPPAAVPVADPDDEHPASRTAVAITAARPSRRRGVITPAGYVGCVSAVPRWERVGPAELSGRVVPLLGGGDHAVPCRQRVGLRGPRRRVRLRPSGAAHPPAHRVRAAVPAA